MEGVTILNTVEKTVMANPTAIFFIIFLVAGIFLGIVALGISFNIHEKLFLTVTSISLVSLILAINIAIFGPCEKTIQYDVLIDDSVSMVEFNQKYEIIDQKGLIYVIIDRELSE